jgi:hypothetical protein
LNRIVIFDEAFARRFRNGRDPIGNTVNWPRALPPEPDMEIVGIVADAVHQRLGDPAPPTL